MHQKLKYGLLLFFILGTGLILWRLYGTFEKKLTDVSYSSHPSCRMDVFLPGNRTPETPFIILIHGGAWVAGDKLWLRRLQKYLLVNGIASANINYRLADKKIHYADILLDIDNAISFCEINAEKWDVRNSGYALCGTSAGGHLALLSGFRLSKKISAIMAMCPFTDLTDSLMIKSLQHSGLINAVNFLAGNVYQPVLSAQVAFRPVSPIYHIKNIPILLIHGTGDAVVPHSQSAKLSDALNRAGIQQKFISITGANHDLNILTDPETGKMIYGEIAGWAKKYWD